MMACLLLLWWWLSRDKHAPAIYIWVCTFLLSTRVCSCSPVQNIQDKVDAARLQRPWSLAERRQQLCEDEALRQHNASAKEQGMAQRFFWRSLYLPEQGMFCQAPRDLHLGITQKVQYSLFGSDTSQGLFITFGISYKRSTVERLVLEEPGRLIMNCFYTRQPNCAQASIHTFC